ncbi:MAG: radical SAM protein, partial [Candidatus Lokiarchaeota archaeon]|nr:radical SAM protein [Candidatus Lokiarchaeota archaeon]
ITRYAKQIFPRLERVGVYACGEDVLAKSNSELQDLAAAGLGIAYVGLESGDDAILKQIKKNITADQLVQAARKLMKNGITFSGTLIAGIAGKDEQRSRAHAIASARMINRMSPDDHQTWYIGVLTLMIPPRTAVAKARDEGRFVPMDEVDIVKEVRLLIENIDEKVHDCVFRSNHASNYVVLKGILARDKPALLATIDAALANPRRYFRPEWYRGL